MLQTRPLNGHGVSQGLYVSGYAPAVSVTTGRKEQKKMSRKNVAVTLSAVAGVSLAGVGVTSARQGAKPAPKPAPAAASTPAKPAPSAAPAVAGDWTGDWGMYSPPPKDGQVPPAVKKAMYPIRCMQMDCKVEALPGGKWQATFEGECGKPYKYTIKMQGRTAGGVVMFQGSADLGAQDGGVFDWIGRASDREFVGFFTSKGYTGTFRLTRK